MRQRKRGDTTALSAKSERMPGRRKWEARDQSERQCAFCLATNSLSIVTRVKEHLTDLSLPSFWFISKLWLASTITYPSVVFVERKWPSGLVLKESSRLLGRRVD